MNRRNFLKRIAAVAAGVVVAPTVVKTLLFKPNPVQREILYGSTNIRYRWCYSRGLPAWAPTPEYDFLYETSKNPEYTLGTVFYAPDGRVFRYVRMVNNVNNSKNNLHNQA